MNIVKELLKLRSAYKVTEFGIIQRFDSKATIELWNKIDEAIGKLGFTVDERKPTAMLDNHKVIVADTDEELAQAIENYNLESAIEIVRPISRRTIQRKHTETQQQFILRAVQYLKEDYLKPFDIPEDDNKQSILGQDYI